MPDCDSARTRNCSAEIPSGIPVLTSVPLSRRGSPTNVSDGARPQRSECQIRRAGGSICPRRLPEREHALARPAGLGVPRKLSAPPELPPSCDRREVTVDSSLPGRFVRESISEYSEFALPNDASVALHVKLGFQLVGIYRRIGWKAGTWRDVGWWQLGLVPATDGAPPEPGPPATLGPA